MKNPPIDKKDVEKFLNYWPENLSVREQELLKSFMNHTNKCVDTTICTCPICENLRDKYKEV